MQAPNLYPNSGPNLRNFDLTKLKEYGNMMVEYGGNYQKVTNFTKRCCLDKGELMRLFFLGTGAAEGYPALFCECANCQEARALGGRNLRLRSMLLINEDLLFDAGPDLGAVAMRYGLQLSRVRILLFTHLDDDHFCPSNLMWRASENRLTPLPLLKVFGPPAVIEVLLNPPAYLPGLDLDDARLSLNSVKPFSMWREDPYCFYSYPAQHGRGEKDALFYSVYDGKHHVLYAVDTGPWAESVWQALAKHKFDVVILDETMGYESSGGGHHNLSSFLEVYRRFRNSGLLREGALFIAHHISHSNPPHDRLVELLEPQGVKVAYDGMCLTLD